MLAVFFLRLINIYSGSCSKKRARIDYRFLNDVNEDNEKIIKQIDSFKFEKFGEKNVDKIYKDCQNKFIEGTYMSIKEEGLISDSLKCLYKKEMPEEKPKLEICMNTEKVFIDDNNDKVFRFSVKNVGSQIVKHICVKTKVVISNVKKIVISKKKDFLLCPGEELDFPVSISVPTMNKIKYNDCGIKIIPLQVDIVINNVEINNLTKNFEINLKKQ